MHDRCTGSAAFSMNKKVPQDCEARYTGREKAHSAVEGVSMQLQARSCEQAAKMMEDSTHLEHG